MEWTRVQAWARAGLLPHLARLLETGVRAELRGFGDTLPDTVWPTLCLGVNPGQLEKYFYIQYDAETGGLGYAADDRLEGRPFWSELCEAGLRVVVADVPHLPFHPVPGGFHVMGFGAHDNKGGLRTDPPELGGEVLGTLGPHPVGDCERYNKTPRSRARLERDILDGIAAQGALFRWLMDRSPWDLLFAVFSAAHCVGHHFWHRDEANGPVEQAYRAIDREIGALLARADPETRVMVFAPHGMGALAHASWNLDEVLELLGYGERAVATAPPEARRGRVNPWRKLRMILPSRLQYWIKDRLPASLEERLLIQWYSNRFRGPKHRAFALPNNEVVGAIRVSLAGRDAGGCVAPGAEYERVVDDLAAAFSELRDPVSGRGVVRRVIRLAERYAGPHVADLPDLAVQWETEFSWDRIASPRIGEIAIQRQDARSGSHTDRGWLLAAGPGVAGPAEVRGASTLDIAATALSTAGVPIPERLEGQPIEALRSDED